MIYLLILLIMSVSWFLPWWAPGALCFLGGLRANSYRHAFISGFLAVTVTWVVVAYYFDLKSHGLISTRTAAIFGLPSPLFSYLVMGLLGGFWGGLWCCAGQALRLIVSKHPHKTIVP